MTLFPLGIATGPAFCNREAERRHLAQNLLNGQHTLLLAPRRYGKTSLVLQVLEDLGDESVSWQTMDFLLAYDRSSVEDTVLDAIGRLVGDILPLHKKAIQKLGAFFASLKPEITLSEDGARVRFFPVAAGRDAVVDALEGLDQVAGEEGIRAVLVLDEFQQIGTLKDGQAVEAAIRHAAERARHISYIFSGSNRHMLASLFDDSARPLYHLCDRLPLERIAVDAYGPFLQAAAKQQWACGLDNVTLDAILSHTARHPYYLNLLCSRLWREPGLPDVQTVAAVWQHYIHEERNRLAREVSDLSPNQRAVISALATLPTDQPLGAAFLRHIRLAGTSAAQAVQVLLEKDLIYRDDASFLRLHDPALQSYLASLKR